jgi:hypothetical protein
MKKYSRLAGIGALLFTMFFGLIPTVNASEPVFGDKDVGKPVFVVEHNHNRKKISGFHAVYRIFYLPDGGAVNNNENAAGEPTLNLWTHLKKGSRRVNM